MVDKSRVRSLFVGRIAEHIESNKKRRQKLLQLDAAGDGCGPTQGELLVYPGSQSHIRISRKRRNSLTNKHLMAD